MQVQPITNNTFASKNTFLQKSKQAISVEDKTYYKSLHYEAKARMNYIKFQKLAAELAENDSLNSAKNIWNVMKLIVNMASKKLNSMSYQTDSINMYPTRFYKADDPKVFPYRYYKTNK